MNSLTNQKIARELTEVQLVVERATNQAKKARLANDIDYWFACALSLQNFYEGVEKIFKLIALNIDKDLPLGQEWHKELLEQMSIAWKHRPAVISPVSKNSLDYYRGFRHIVVHNYCTSLDISKLGLLIDNLPTTYAAFQNDIDCFQDYLLQIHEIDIGNMLELS